MIIDREALRVLDSNFHQHQSIFSCSDSGWASVNRERKKTGGRESNSERGKKEKEGGWTKGEGREEQENLKDDKC